MYSLILIYYNKLDTCQGIDPDEFKSILFDICCINDDDTTQLLNTILILYQQHKAPSLFLQLNPHTSFLFFLNRCGYTHDILIDLLLEDDSNFLEFFYRYIIYAIEDINTLKQCLGKEEEEMFIQLLNNTISVLMGDGFPYNTKPLIKRLIQLINVIQ
jgi:hypothetical protein